jgi:hypothetical protein
MPEKLTLRARTDLELDAIDEWIIDSWLNAPMGSPSAERDLHLSIEQSPDEVDTEMQVGMPNARNHQKTAFYVEYDQPVVVCELILRGVETVLCAPEHGLPLSAGIEFDADSRILAIDHGVVEVEVSALDVELSIEPVVVRWRRKRLSRIGPLAIEKTD